MIKEGKIAGRGVLLAGQPGTGKTAIAMGELRTAVTSLAAERQLALLHAPRYPTELLVRPAAPGAVRLHSLPRHASDAFGLPAAALTLAAHP